MKRALLETGRWTIGHAAGCLSKAEALANILDANGFSAATAKGFGVGQWHMAALIAEVPNPSPETQAVVVRMLQDKDAARAAARGGFLDLRYVSCFRSVARGLPRSIGAVRKECQVQVISPDLWVK